MITVSQPDLGRTEAAAIQSVIASHWVGLGPRTAAFEEALAEYLGVRHVIATSSCTGAIHLTLAALEPDRRDEIIVPSLTFVATVQAIILAGYKPVFVEVNPKTLTIDVDDVARMISKRTRAFLPVHFAGYPCDIKRLNDLARHADISIVSDGAHAFGCTIGGQSIARQGLATCFSFSANKNVTCGEGGAIATGSNALASRLKKMRFLGITHPTWERRAQDKPWQYIVESTGFRYHMSDLNAAIGLAQLKRLDRFAKIRRKIAATYDAGFEGLPRTMPVARDLQYTIPHLYIMRVTHGLRNALYDHLRINGITCGVHYVPNHLQPAFKKFSRSLPVTEQLADELISLPLHTRLASGDVQYIVGKVSGFLNRAGVSPRRKQGAGAVFS
jgi:perosamine synthetase